MIPAHRVEGPASAPVLVLSNSLGTTTELWAPQVPTLATRFRVVRYEHRGHGGTAPPGPGPYTMADLGGDLVELLDHLEVERASIAGVSLGGMVALWVAVHHPRRVERLVLAGTAARLEPPEAWAERAAAVRRAGSPAVLRDALLGRWFVDPKPHLVAGMLEAADAEGYAGCCEAIGATDQRDDLAAVAAPTLVIAGADDPVTPPARALALQAGIPGAALAVLPGASHLANLEQPGAFTDAMVDHLAGRPGARGEAVRRQVLGDEHVQRSTATSWRPAAAFAEFITRAAWGEVWTRPTLDLRTRSCITVALLAGLGRLDELELHVAGARRNGLTDDEIGEVILHTAVYAGAPAANAALRVARRVLDGDG